MSPYAHTKPGALLRSDGLRMVTLLAGMNLLLSLALLWGSEAGARPGFAYSIFLVSGMALAAGGALLSRGKFVAARQWLRARVAPLAGLQRAQAQHWRQLLGFWLACTAPLLLVSNTAAQVLVGSAAVALLMAGIAAIAEWGQLQMPLLRRAWAAWRAYWHWLDGSNKLSIFAVLPMMLMQTGSPDTAHSGLPQWGESLDWRYFLRLTALTLIALRLLQSPDLHWRRLLAPGVRRRHIGWRIWWASLKGNLAITTIALALGLFIDAALGGRHWAHLPLIAAGLLPDLLLATMLAVALRGFSGSQTASVMHLLVITTEFVFIAWALHLNAADPSWHRDIWHALAMGTVMLTLLPLIQRAWARADLALLAAKAQEPPEPNGWER